MGDLIVEIFKEGEKVLLANIYAPNEAQDKFYSQLKNQLLQRSEQKYVSCEILMQ